MGQLYRTGAETFRIPDHRKVWSLSPAGFYLVSFLYQTLSLERKTPAYFPLASYVDRVGLGDKSSRKAVSELEHAALINENDAGLSLLHPATGEPVHHPKRGQQFVFPTCRVPFGFRNSYTPPQFKVVAHIYRVIDQQNFYESDTEIGDAVGMSDSQVARLLRLLRETGVIDSRIIAKESIYTKRKGRYSKELAERFSRDGVQRVRQLMLPSKQLPARAFWDRSQLEITLGYFRESKQFKEGAVKDILEAFGVSVITEDGTLLRCDMGDLGGSKLRRVYTNSGYWFYDLDTKNSRRWSQSKRALVPQTDQREGDFVSLLTSVEPDISKLSNKLLDLAKGINTRSENATEQTGSPPPTGQEILL